jgi:outer membrane usher protein
MPARALACVFVALMALLSRTMVAGAVDWTETLAAVEVNGAVVSKSTIILRDGPGSYAVSVDDLHAWRVVPPERGRFHFDGHDYVALRDIVGVVATLDDPTQTLRVKVPAAMFAPTNLTAVVAPTPPPPSHASGGYLSYDVHGQGGAGSALSGLVDAAVTLGAGVVSTQFFSSPGGQGPVQRIATTYQRDNVANRTSLQIGDTTSDTGGLFPGTAFAGFQYGTNLALAPGLVTRPRFSIQGKAEGPSLVDAYVDGALAVHDNLPAGPFQISDIVPRYGVGDIQLVVRDTLGREQVINVPYATTAQLLKGGISEFSAGAGFVRLYSPSGNAYGPVVVAATGRRGLNDSVTAQLHAEWSPSYGSAVASAIWSVKRIGTFDASIGDDTRVTSNLIGGLGWQFFTRSFSLGLNAGIFPVLTATVTPGATPAPGRQTYRANLGVPVTRRGALELSYASQTIGSTHDKLVTANYGTSLGRARLTVGVFNASGTTGLNVVTVQVSTPLHFGLNSASLGEIVENGHVTGSATFQQNAQFVGARPVAGYALTVGQGPGAPSQAAIDYPTTFADLGAGLVTGPQSTYFFDARGSLADVGGHAFLSRQILQSYGIAVLPGYGNVPVYANGSLAGITDKTGTVLLPALYPYQNNTVSLDYKTIPIALNVDTPSAQAVPYLHMPVIVRFGTNGVGGVLIHLRRPDGTFVPAGTLLKGSRPKTWPVADSGDAYLDGLTAGRQTLTASWDDTSCAFEIEIPTDTSNTPDLGSVVCK